MIHKDAELLTKQGWSNIRNGEFACIESGRVVWRSIHVQRGRSAFCQVSARFAGLCVDAYHPVAVVRYGTHSRVLSEQCIAAGELSKDWVLVNNFVTRPVSGENPYLAYVNSCSKSSAHTPRVGVLGSSSWVCEDDAQFRLIADAVKYQRFAAMLKWHGRSYVEDLNGREMRGTCEFANYSAATTDLFELVALGEGRQVERLSARRLRVHNRWRLRVEGMLRFHDYGYSLKGDSDFILIRFQGKTAIVGLND